MRRLTQSPVRYPPPADVPGCSNSCVKGNSTHEIPASSARLAAFEVNPPVTSQRTPFRAW
jgi:hypothetical protein